MQENLFTKERILGVLEEWAAEVSLADETLDIQPLKMGACKKFGCPRRTSTL